MRINQLYRDECAMSINQNTSRDNVIFDHIKQQQRQHHPVNLFQFCLFNIAEPNFEHEARVKNMNFHQLFFVSF